MIEYGPAIEAAYRNLGNLEGTPWQPLVRKAIMQAHILGCEIGDSPFAEDKPIKTGIFMGYPTLVETTWSSDNDELVLEAGDTYWDIHMPKAAKGEARLSRQSADAGYSEMAEVVNEHEEISNVVGFTYTAIAYLAFKNQQFHRAKVNLPEELHDLAVSVLLWMMPEEDPARFKDTWVVWKPRDEFLDRFLR